MPVHRQGIFPRLALMDGDGWQRTSFVALQTAEACLVRFADGCLCWLDAGVVDQRGDVVGWYGYKRRGKNDWAWVDEMRKAANSANTRVLREMNQRLADLNKQQERTSPWSCFVEAASSLGTEPFRKTLPDFHGIGGEHVARTNPVVAHSLYMTERKPAHVMCRERLAHMTS